MSLNPEQFSDARKREFREAEGHALAEHLFEGAEAIFGPVRAQAIGSAVNHLQANFPGHEVKWDEGDEPYHEVSEGPWSARYHAGPYVEIHHAKHGPLEVLNAPYDHERGRPGALSHEQMSSALHEFVTESGDDYIRNARGGR